MGDAIAVEVTRRLLAVEGVLVFAFALLVMVSGALSRRRLRRQEARMTAGRTLLVRALGEAQPDAAAVRSLQRLPWGVQCDLVLEFGASLAGDGRARLSMVGHRAGIAARAEALCASPFWWRRLAGARVITALNYDCAAVRGLLDDPNATVRAQALAWAAGRVDQRVIEEMVAHLVDAEQLCRFVVQDSLLRIGHPASGALARFLATHDGPGLVDALAVARGLAEPELLEPVLRLGNHASDEIRAHAGAALAVLGGRRAVAMLERHLDDPAPGVRAAAARAIGDLGHWQSSGELSRLLGDQAWPVRREAALALRRMGGVGLLTLRRALHHANPFAADMARQVLDLPENVYRRIAV